MITLFKANDGKIFEDEDKCLAYEKMLEYEDKDNSIIFADENGKIFSLNDIIKNYDLAGSMFYIYVKNFEGWSAGCDIIYEEYGFEFPDWADYWNKSSCHCWFWDELKAFGAKWVELDEAYKELNGKNKIFNKMIAEIT